MREHSYGLLIAKSGVPGYWEIFKKQTDEHICSYDAIDKIASEFTSKTLRLDLVHLHDLYNIVRYLQ